MSRRTGVSEWTDGEKVVLAEWEKWDRENERAESEEDALEEMLDVERDLAPGG